MNGGERLRERERGGDAENGEKHDVQSVIQEVRARECACVCVVFRECVCVCI